MKKLIKLCVSSVAISTFASNSMLCASGDKITMGNSVGKYAKPGAPVDIRFSSQNVLAGESAEVKISLLSSVKSGSMYVLLKLGSGLYTTEKMEKNVYFNLNAKNKPYPIILHLSANTDNVYYVRLMVSIEGKGSRTFAVPVFIGEGRVKKSHSLKLSRSISGENLSVSKAVESSD